MEQVEILKRRIHVAEELHSLVRTMKALAAVNIRQLELAVQSLRSYHETVESGFQAVLCGQPTLGQWMDELPGSGRGLLALGSDQGMCGPMNERLARQCLAWREGNNATGQISEQGLEADSRSSRTTHKRSRQKEFQHSSVFCVGLRLASRLNELGLDVHRSYPMAQSLSGLSIMVDELIIELDRWRQEEELGQIDVVFAIHQSRSSFTEQQMTLLPLDVDWLQRLQSNAWPGRQIPMVWGDRRTRFMELTREYLFCELYRTCAETMASENASRLMAMRQAEQNIENRRDELQRQYVEARQTAITEELLDIASGFEAIEGDI